MPQKITMLGIRVKPKEEKIAEKFIENMRLLLYKKGDWIVIGDEKLNPILISKIKDIKKEGFSLKRSVAEKEGHYPGYIVEKNGKRYTILAMKLNGEIFVPYQSHVMDRHEKYIRKYGLSVLKGLEIAARNIIKKTKYVKYLSYIPTGMNGITALNEHMGRIRSANDINKELRRDLFIIALNFPPRYKSISRAGAIGLFQITPSTARRLEKKYNTIALFKKWAEKHDYPTDHMKDIKSRLMDPFYASLLAMFHHIDVVSTLETRARLDQKIKGIKSIYSWKTYRNYIMKEMKKGREEPIVAYIASAYNGGTDKPAYFIGKYGYKWHNNVTGRRYRYLIKATRMDVRENVGYVKKVINLLSVMRLLKKIKGIPVRKADTTVGISNISDTISERMSKVKSKKAVSKSASMTAHYIGISKVDGSKRYRITLNKPMDIRRITKTIKLNKKLKSKYIEITNEYGFPLIANKLNKGDTFYVKTFSNENDYRTWLSMVKAIITLVGRSRDGAAVYRVTLLTNESIPSFKKRLMRMGIKNIKITDKFGRELKTSNVPLFYIKAY